MSFFLQTPLQYRVTETTLLVVLPAGTEVIPACVSHSCCLASALHPSFLSGTFLGKV